MESFGVRRASEFGIAAAAALVLAAFTIPVNAQLATDDEPQLQQIQQIHSRDGPYSFALLEPLTSLGLLYQESEDYALAIVTFERALQIVRINKGLHSLEQVPLVRYLMRIEDERGNHASAWERQQDLLRLVRRYPDDVRTVPVLREIADNQMAVLNEVIVGKRPPEVVLGCYYQEWSMHGDGSCDSGSKSTVIQGMLADAQRNYSDAIAVMLRQGLYGDDLRELELDVLRGVLLMQSGSQRGSSSRSLSMAPAFMGVSGAEPWRGRIAAIIQLASWDLPYPNAGSLESDSNVLTKHVHVMDPYERGRQSLRRLYAYGVASSDSPLRQADAMAQIGDWDLLYSHNGKAMESYALARAMLEQAGGAAASIDELFAPSTPVVLPAFQPNPLMRDETRATTGYIDVAFEITKYGQSRALEILDAANATPAAKRSLLALIRNNRFRPQLTDGEFADATPVRVRYYLY
jgi:tetratricopeptide (TPR) repeat protein